MSRKAKEAEEPKVRRRRRASAKSNPNPLLQFGLALLIALPGIIGAFAAVNANSSANQAAIKVEQVKQDLNDEGEKTEKTLEHLTTQADKTHTLVNSNMGVQLQLNAAVTKRLANMTGNPADIEAANLAQTLWREHQRKQADVDAQEKKSGGT